MTTIKTLELEVISCCSCGFSFGLPVAWLRSLRSDGSLSFYCPSCKTSQGWSGRSENDRLKRELAETVMAKNRAKEEARRAQQDAHHFERSRNAYKGKVTHLKGKIVEGLCPICNHGFPNLKRHIEAQHPEFKVDDEPEGS